MELVDSGHNMQTDVILKIQVLLLGVPGWAHRHTLSYGRDAQPLAHRPYLAPSFAASSLRFSKVPKGLRELVAKKPWLWKMWMLRLGTGARPDTAASYKQPRDKLPVSQQELKSMAASGSWPSTGTCFRKTIQEGGWGGVHVLLIQ